MPARSDGATAVRTELVLRYTLQVGGEYLMFTSAWGDELRTTKCDGSRSASGGPPVTESTTTVAASPCGLAAA